MGRVGFDGNLPAYINITNGKTADNKGAYDIALLKGSVVVADSLPGLLPYMFLWVKIRASGWKKDDVQTWLLSDEVVDTSRFMPGRAIQQQ